MDPRAAMAREFHQKSLKSQEHAATHRQARDEVVQQLRASNPAKWTYEKLARAVGCSPELVAHIVKKVDAP